MNAGQIWRIVLFLAVLVPAACDLQKNMLYYPDRSVPSRSELETEGLQFWPSGPDNYRGFVGTAQAAPGKGTVVVLHGNAATARDRTYYVKALAPLGYRTVLAEYPGYGARTGEPGEALFVSDAAETLSLAADLYGRPLFLLGESLGCAVAAAVARSSPAQIDGLILITPWDSLRSVAQEKFPWLPVRLFLKDGYDSIANLKGYRGTIAVIGAERDAVIPIGHAKALYAALPGRKKMWTIEGAGHNDWLRNVDRPWWKDIMDFAAGGNER